jgi:hypothetical protein
MSRSRSFVCSLGFVLAALPACAIVDDDGVEAADQDVLAGSLSGDRTVLALRAAGDDATEQCTAVLVAPDAVVTAAHCVHPNWVGRGVRVTVTDRDTVGGSGWTGGYAPIIHPDFDPAHVERGHDIAVVLLRSRYTTPPAVLTAWTLPDAWGDEAARAASPTTLRVVGYGAAVDDPDAATDRRRERFVPLTDLTDQHVVAGNGTDGQPCYGDSGGPTFLGYWGAWNVVSIASFVYGDCQGGNWGTRIDTNYDFLVAALGDRIPAALLPPPASFPGAL